MNCGHMEFVQQGSEDGFGQSLFPNALKFLAGLFLNHFRFPNIDCSIEIKHFIEQYF